MKWMPVFAAAGAVFLTYSCGRRPEPAVLLVYQGGNQYEILDKGDLLDQDNPARFIRYYSADPFSPSIRAREHKDLLAMMARHVNTNMEQRIIITAVERGERFFGLLKPREHVTVYTTDDMIKRMAGKKKATGR